MQQQVYKILGIIGAVIIFILIGAFANHKTSNPSQNGPIPPEGAITLRGTIVCLLHRDTSREQTLECAIGFKDDTGRYFSLTDPNPTYGNIGTVPMNAPVEISGIFTARPSPKYQDIGVISVTKIGQYK